MYVDRSSYCLDSFCRRARRSLCVGAVFAIALMMALEASAQSAFTISAVARQGDPAPVPPRLVRASAPALNNVGQIAFVGDGGLLLWSDGALHVVAAPGDPAPGGGRFSLISAAALNDAGDMAFVATVTAPGRSGWFVYSGGALSAIARTGDPAPGGGTFTFANALGLPPRPSINGLGDVVFPATIDLAGTLRSGIFLYSGGSVTAVLQEPSAPFAVATWFIASVDINDARQVLFRLSSVGAPPSSSRIFVQTLQPRVLRQIAPQFSRTPDGGTFLNVAQEPSMNAAGEVAFWADFVAANGQPTSGLFLQSGSTVQEIARRDSLIPGGSGNETIRTFSRPSLNASGEVAFHVTYGDGRHAILLWQGGVITRLAATGDSSPSSSPLTSATTPSFNAVGQVSFIGTTVDSLETVYLITERMLSRVVGSGDTVAAVPRYSAFPIAAGLFAVPAGARSTMFMGRTFPGALGIFDGSQRLIGEGDSAPGGGVISSLGQGVAASNGISQVSVLAALSTGETALFLVSGSGLSELIRTGKPLPDGTTFVSLTSPVPAPGLIVAPIPSMNVHGDLAFYGTTSTGQTGIYLLRQGGVIPVARIGDPAPTGGIVSAFTGTLDSSFSVNDLGQVAFSAVTTNAGTPGRCICRWDNGRTIALAATSSFTASLSNAGEVAFTGALVTNGPTSTVFLSTANGNIVIARSGDPAPGGGVFGAPFSGGPIMSLDGQLTFLMSDPQSTAIFAYVDGLTELVAKGGDAPREDGFAFRSLGAPRAISRTEIVFTAATSDGLLGVFIATRPPSTPRLQITTPNDPSDWGIGTRQVIAWTYSGPATHLDVEISRDAGASWELLRRVPNRGASQNARITVPSPATAAARVRVTAVGDPLATDTNDSEIRIADAFIDVILPVEGESVRRGARGQIFIGHNVGARVPVAVDVSTDGGQTWRNNVERARTRGATTSSIGWTADLRPTTAARVRVRALDGSGAVGISSAFTVRRARADEADVDPIPSSSEAN